jgi:hypothetical protein
LIESKPFFFEKKNQKTFINKANTKDKIPSSPSLYLAEGGVGADGPTSTQPSKTQAPTSRCAT